LIYLLIFQFEIEIELLLINFGFKDQWLKTHIIHKAKTQVRTNTLNEKHIFQAHINIIHSVLIKFNLFLALVKLKLT
jgi:hypothetical protein